MQKIISCVRKSFVKERLRTLTTNIFLITLKSRKVDEVKNQVGWGHRW